MWTVKYGYFSWFEDFPYSHYLNSTGLLIRLAHFAIKAVRRARWLLGHEASTGFLCTHLCAACRGHLRHNLFLSDRALGVVAVFCHDVMAGFLNAQRHDDIVRYKGLKNKDYSHGSSHRIRGILKTH